MAGSDLYDRDFYAWAKEQAALLRAGDLMHADIAHIAEEIESMGRTEKRELVSRLTMLLLHLLKWRHQPVGRGNSWRLSIANSRDEIARRRHFPRPVPGPSMRSWTAASGLRDDPSGHASAFIAAAEGLKTAS